MRTITLTHYERGPIEVAIHDEASFWCGRTFYVPDDPELGYFDARDFDETPEEINAKLAELREGELI